MLVDLLSLQLPIQSCHAGVRKRLPWAQAAIHGICDRYYPLYLKPRFFCSHRLARLGGEEKREGTNLTNLLGIHHLWIGVQYSLLRYPYYLSP